MSVELAKLGGFLKKPPLAQVIKGAQAGGRKISLFSSGPEKAKVALIHPEGRELDEKKLAEIFGGIKLPTDSLIFDFETRSIHHENDLQPDVLRQVDLGLANYEVASNTGFETLLALWNKEVGGWHEFSSMHLEYAFTLRTILDTVHGIRKMILAGTQIKVGPMTMSGVKSNRWDTTASIVHGLLSQIPGTKEKESFYYKYLLMSSLLTIFKSQLYKGVTVLDTDSFMQSLVRRFHHAQGRKYLELTPKAWLSFYYNKKNIGRPYSAFKPYVQFALDEQRSVVPVLSDPWDIAAAFLLAMENNKVSDFVEAYLGKVLGLPVNLYRHRQEDGVGILVYTAAESDAPRPSSSARAWQPADPEKLIAIELALKAGEPIIFNSSRRDKHLMPSEVGAEAYRLEKRSSQPQLQWLVFLSVNGYSPERGRYVNPGSFKKDQKRLGDSANELVCVAGLKTLLLFRNQEGERSVVKTVRRHGDYLLQLVKLLDFAFEIHDKETAKAEAAEHYRRNLAGILSALAGRLQEQEREDPSKIASELKNLATSLDTL